MVNGSGVVKRIAELALPRVRVRRVDLLSAPCYSTSMSVRTRFAPSPTGYLHLGGARTALFNYLFARRHRGTFVLRIEDTDRERSSPEATHAILDSLRWLRLEWDEGPYFQSARLELYREQAERLLASGAAYWCRCTPADLEVKRKAAVAAGRKPTYDRTCRDARRPREDGRTVLRFRAPLSGETAWVDLVKGPIVFQNEELDDIVLLRSDGTPTFNFCVVVDDALMGITHLIRGEDHIPNTPKQIQLYRALGFPMPQFAHVPLILGLDRSRLSKRHGATSVAAYREAGYLPDALVNYLVRLGWACGDQEIFSREELIEKFSLEGVGKSASVFNPEKLQWVNFQHLKAMPVEELTAAVVPFIERKGYRVPEDRQWLQAVVKTLQERAKTLVELVDLARYYLSDEVAIDPAAAEKHLRTTPSEWLEEVRDRIARTERWTPEEIRGVFEAVTQHRGVSLGAIAQPVRVALTGSTASPGIFDVIYLLGKERVVARLDRVLRAPVAAANAQR